MHALSRSFLVALLTLTLLIASNKSYGIAFGIKVVDGPSGLVDFPDVGRIRLQGNPNPLCTGTLIGASHVITTASCMQLFSGNTLWGGGVTLSAAATPVIRRIEHYDYSLTRNMGTDIMILILAEDRSITPIPLASAVPSIGTAVDSVSARTGKLPNRGEFFIAANPRPNQLATLRETADSVQTDPDGCYTVSRAPSAAFFPDTHGEPIFTTVAGPQRVLLGMASLTCPRITSADARFGYTSVTRHLPWIESTIDSTKPYTAGIYAKRVFLDLMERTPSAQQLTDLTSEVTGNGRVDAMAAFTKSAEFTQLLITRYFEKFLLRAPTPTELSTYSQRLVDGAAEEEVVADILANEFYTARIAMLPNKERAYVNSLVRFFVGVPFSSADTESLVALFKTTPRPDFTLTFLRSAPAAQKFARYLYRRYVRRDPTGVDGSAADNAHLAVAAAITAGTLTYDQARRNIVTSDDYHNNPLD